MNRLTARLRWAVREFAEGLAYFGVCYGHLPPYGWRPHRWSHEWGGAGPSGPPGTGPENGPETGRRITLDRPPPGHPERLEPADPSRRTGRPVRRRRWAR